MYFNDSKVFIECSNNKMIFTKILKNINKKKNPKILIVFDNIIADMISNKKQSNSNLIFLLEAEN